MPKKQKADIEQAQAAGTAAAAPAKKRSSSTSKSAAATHKAAAPRTATRPSRKKVTETGEPAVVVETVEVVVAQEQAAVEAAPQAPAIEALVAAVVEAEPEIAQYHEPGTPGEREEIARIAYSYWVARSFGPGDPFIDWLRAEEEYRSRRYAKA